jgi:hypothetical protein
MTDTTKDGGPAFPLFTPEGQFNGAKSESGMTLLDYFAAAALQGILASEENSDITWPKDARSGESCDEWIARIADERAKFCYLQAAAMLKARQS